MYPYNVSIDDCHVQDIRKLWDYHLVNTDFINLGDFTENCGLADSIVVGNCARTNDYFIMYLILFFSIRCTQFNLILSTVCVWAGQCSWYSNWLRAGRSGDRIPVGARFSAPVQTSPGSHPASCTMGTGSFPGVKSGRAVTLTPHPLLVLWSRKCRAIPLLPRWAVQSLNACTRVHFTLHYIRCLCNECT